VAAFRQALSLAINRRGAVDAEFNGQTEPAQIDPGHRLPLSQQAPTNSFTAHDPERPANRLLDFTLGLTRATAKATAPLRTKPTDVFSA